jgi:hypothetical protein
MPPEKVTKVLVLDLEGGEPPRATRYTAAAVNAEFLVKWYPLFFFTSPGSVYWATTTGTWGDAVQSPRYLNPDP